MNFFPVFARELRGERRNRALRAKRFASAAVAGLGFAGLLLLNGWKPELRALQCLKFVPLGGSLSFILFIIGLARSVTFLSQERRDGMLPLLFLTRLTGFDIVFGKLLQALLVDLAAWLAMLPFLIVPLAAMGYPLLELALTALGCLNVFFFALALGSLVSALGSDRAVSWIALVFLPLIIDLTPAGFFLPAALRIVMDWLNPFAALSHVQLAAVGFRSSAFWRPLAESHVAAWCLLMLSAWLLPRSNRRQANANADPRHRIGKRRWLGNSGSKMLSPALRTRLLDRNPFLWLASRERWAGLRIWAMIVVPPVAWGLIAWLIWSGRGVNVTALLAIANGMTWFVMLVVMVPADASRQLAEDRLTGTLEMLLCTPLSVQEMVRGQWIALRRRYLLPMLAMILLSSGLMIAGYATYGFGGGIDSADRELWLFWWLFGILLLPLCLGALSWLAMRRTLFARHAGEAGSIAIVQIVTALSFAGYGICEISRICKMPWHGTELLLSVTSVLLLAAFAFPARRKLLRDFRLPKPI